MFDAQLDKETRFCLTILGRKEKEWTWYRTNCLVWETLCQQDRKHLAYLHLKPFSISNFRELERERGRTWRTFCRCDGARRKWNRKSCVTLSQTHVAVRSDKTWKWNENKNSPRNDFIFQLNRPCRSPPPNMSTPPLRSASSRLIHTFWTIKKKLLFFYLFWLILLMFQGCHALETVSVLSEI